jgi:hypothetical protein
VGGLHFNDLLVAGLDQPCNESAAERTALLLGQTPTSLPSVLDPRITYPRCGQT